MLPLVESFFSEDGGGGGLGGSFGGGLGGLGGTFGGGLGGLGGFIFFDFQWFLLILNCFPQLKRNFAALSRKRSEDGGGSDGFLLIFECFLVFERDFAALALVERFCLRTEAAWAAWKACSEAAWETCQG